MREENLYERFLNQNQERVNKSLNRIAWLFVLVGPVITFGVITGYFKTVTLRAGVSTTAALMLVAMVHSLFVKKYPGSSITSFVVLVGIQLTMTYMAYYHIGIYASWFLIPLVSLLYCRKKIFHFAAIMSYVIMVGTLWLIAPYQSSLRIDYTPIMWFGGMAGGMTIEFVIMFIAGTYVSDLIDEQLKLLYGSTELISVKERENYQDKLTGLWNKKYVEMMFNDWVVNKNGNYSFFILDLDNFKQINDSYGHLDGDTLLVSLSKVLKDTFNDPDHTILSRFGGDEFIGLLPIEDEELLAKALEKLMVNVREKFSDEEKYSALTLSIGATLANKAISYSDIFNQADNSLRYVKRNGKNTYHIYHIGDVEQAPIIGR